MGRRSIVDRAEANTVPLRPRTIDGRLLGLLIALPGTFWSGTYLAVKLADAVSVDATPTAIAFTQVSLGLCLAPIVLIPLCSPKKAGALHVILGIIALMIQLAVCTINSF